jgi:hypothetical protein
MVATECLSEHMTVLKAFFYERVTVRLRLIAEASGLGQKQGIVALTMAGKSMPYAHVALHNTFAILGPYWRLGLDEVILSGYPTWRSVSACTGRSYHDGGRPWRQWGRMATRRRRSRRLQHDSGGSDRVRRCPPSRTPCTMTHGRRARGPIRSGSVTNGVARRAPHRPPPSAL